MKRIIIKLSGEALGGNGQVFDFDHAEKTARTLVKASQAEYEIGVVIGAGNIWRGREGRDMDAVTAHQMGMLATMVNCLYMTDAVRRAGGKSRVMSAFEMPRICEEFNAGRAIKAMLNGEIVFFGGGSGNPFFTTDTAVVLRAVETKADIILLAKNIDGVYTADPRQDPTATLIKDITYEEAEARKLRVMDAAAFAMCAEERVPQVRVFGLNEPENILKVLAGDPMGTVLHP